MGLPSLVVADQTNLGDEVEHRDQLPGDLDVTGLVGPYTFPDIRRRLYPGLIYLAMAGGLAAVYVVRGDGVLVNDGLVWCAAALALIGVYHLLAAHHLEVLETDALVSATREVGFAVGHASAQLGWRGLRSRPTWRILLYSAEEPPTRRGLVLVDGVNGSVVDYFVEENPEDWSAFSNRL
ncbi:MAG TPA: hypothetical protein VMY34_03110 [Acidimicrobiales bacterium]|nr:hypothetical protein [Acidimicrobiales bacterium]